LLGRITIGEMRKKICVNGTALADSRPKYQPDKLEKFRRLEGNK